MKFSMGTETLSTHTRATGGAGEELTTLVRQLALAAEPLEGRFRGAARAAFDNFKARTDEIAVELGSALGAVLEGNVGMDRAFVAGEQEQMDSTRSLEGSSAFDAARFAARA